MKDKRYDILLEVITPLAVGAGNDNDWVKGADYVQSNGKLYVLDLGKMIAIGVDAERLTSYLSRLDERSICDMLGNNLSEASKYVFELPANTDNPIKSFLRSQLYDRPLVAGSSLKGAIRSALFNFLRDNEERNEEVFGKLNNGSDFMRFIKIGDFEMKKTVLTNTKIFNLMIDNQKQWVGGWKQGNRQTIRKYNPIGFNTLYECVPPGEKGLGTITMASGTFEQFLKDNQRISPHSDKKSIVMNGGIRELFKIINEVTKDYLFKEKEFFGKFEGDRTDEILDGIDQLVSMIPDDNSSCIMKMSAGSGYHSITGNWKFDNFTDIGSWQNGKKKYKSRKIAEYQGILTLMGFVKLSLMNEETLSEEKSSIESEHYKLLEDIRTAPKKRQEQIRQAEEQKRIRVEEKQEEQRIRNEYAQLITEATNLYHDNKNTDALNIAKRAEAIWPEGTKHQTLIDKIQKSLDIENQNKERKEQKLRQMAMPLADVLSGKNSSFGNILGTLEKWIRQEGNSFGDEEEDVLVAALKSLSKKEQKRISRGRIKSIIGEDRTNSLYSKLG